MDRLAESIRVTPTNRAEGIDFTRPHAARDEVETRVHERNRSERANEKPEGFAQHLEEESAARESETTDAARNEAQEPPDTQAGTEGTRPEPKSEPALTQATTAQLPTTALDAPTAPQLGGAAPEPSALVPLAPPAASAVALPETANMPLASNVLKPAEDQAAITVAQPAAAEQVAIEVESSTSVGAPRTDTGTSQVQAPTHSRETPVPALEVEAPRETPAVRSAHEVERAAEILRQVRVQITPELSAARIQLQPVELGRVTIDLRVEEGRLKTVVRAEKTETLQAIQTHLPELRAALRQHGIDAQEFQLMLGFEQRQHRDADHAPAQTKARTSSAEIPALERSPALHAAVSQTGVDLYA